VYEHGGSGVPTVDGSMAMAKPHIAVVGAGAFGAWTALFLLRRGARVTLVDAWGPGNSRASSGGETRIIRGGYGANQPYTRMAGRALTLWREHEKRWSRKFLHQTGVLWMAGDKDEFERGSLVQLREAGLPFEELSVGSMKKRWPQINFEGVRWGFYETEGGYLTARSSCRVVVMGFLEEGGEFRQAWVAGEAIESDPASGVRMSDGTPLFADQYVFACGPWLDKVFPETLGNKICTTKQDVLFFGTPNRNDLFEETKLPVWADHGKQFFYGIPGNQYRGFKVADDTRGAPFDPTSGERMVSPESIDKMRNYLRFRFPGMKDAPIVETRVCQYENSPDNNFIIDRHPRAEHMWIVGGGSGHGFKHGPALGEMVAGLVMENKLADPVFRLARFATVRQAT
jgi:glycine/D-amino acid oxidase-like deaminating enzyme